MKKSIESCRLYKGSRSTILDSCDWMCPNPCANGRKALRKISNALLKKHRKLADYMTTGGRIR